MKSVFLGVATLLAVAFVPAEAQQKPSNVQKPSSSCPNGYEKCVIGGTRQGWSSAEASRYCTRACR